MESIKIEGTITAINQVEAKSEKFSLQRFTVKETTEQYPNTFEVQSVGKTLGVLNDYKVGDIVVINANLNGKEYTNKTTGAQGVFMSLSLWKIERKGNQVTPQGRGETIGQQSCNRKRGNRNVRKNR